MGFFSICEIPSANPGTVCVTGLSVALPYLESPPEQIHAIVHLFVYGFWFLQAGFPVVQADV